MFIPVFKISVADKDYWYSKTNNTLYYDRSLILFCPLSNFNVSELESIQAQISANNLATLTSKNKKKP
jgi:hypothetical protein